MVTTAKTCKKAGYPPAFLRETIETGVCIGGPWHGRQIRATGDYLRALRDRTAPVSEVQAQRESMYYAAKMQGKSKDFSFWMHESTDMDEFLAFFFTEVSR